MDDEGKNGNFDFFFSNLNRQQDALFPSARSRFLTCSVFCSFASFLWARASIMADGGCFRVSLLTIRYKLDPEMIWKCHFSVWLSCTHIHQLNHSAVFFTTAMDIHGGYIAGLCSIHGIYRQYNGWLLFSVYHFYPRLCITVFCECLSLCVRAGVFVCRESFSSSN